MRFPWSTDTRHDLIRRAIRQSALARRYPDELDGEGQSRELSQLIKLLRGGAEFTCCDSKSGKQTSIIYCNDTLYYVLKSNDLDEMEQAYNV